MHLEEITASLVNAAIEIYLQAAYGDAVSRDKHAITFSPDKPLADILADFVSEDTPSAQAWSLRLGSQHYPHMKLQLHGTCFPGEYVFAVERHDCFSFTYDAEGMEKWVQLQTQNYALKKKIEEAWYNAGVPTLRSVRERLLSNSARMQTRKRGCILIVDNDDDAAAVFDLILSNGGYRTRRVNSVADAQTLLYDESQHFAAAIIDLILEDGFGQDLVTEIRSNPQTCSLPTVVMTGMAEEDVECREAFDGYLRKPFSAEALLEELKRVIRLYYED